MDDFDLDRSTAQAWTDFQARLAEVVSVMDDSADLTILDVSDNPSSSLAPLASLIRLTRLSVRGCTWTSL